MTWGCCQVLRGRGLLWVGRLELASFMPEFFCVWQACLGARAAGSLTD